MIDKDDACASDDDVAVVEIGVHHHLCRHPRCSARSNHRSFSRVLIPSTSAAAAANTFFVVVVLS